MQIKIFSFLPHAHIKYQQLMYYYSNYHTFGCNSSSCILHIPFRCIEIIVIVGIQTTKTGMHCKLIFGSPISWVSSLIKDAH